MSEQSIQQFILSFFSCYQFPVGRRVFALLEVERRARARGLLEIAEHAARAVAHDRKLLDLLHSDAKPATRAQYGSDARKCSAAVRRLLIAIDGYLVMQRQIFGPGHERTRAAEIVRSWCLPGGAKAHTQQTFPEQYTYVKHVLATIASEPALVAATKRLGELPMLLTELDQANQAYGTALRKSAQELARPSKQALKAARRQGQRLMAEVMAMIIGHFGRHDPDDSGGLRALMQPIVAQNKALAALYRRRRRSVDVDPDTGEDVSSANGDQAAPTAEYRDSEADEAA